LPWYPLIYVNVTYPSLLTLCSAVPKAAPVTIIDPDQDRPPAQVKKSIVSRKLWDRGENIMHRRQALKVFASVALCPLCASTSFAEEGHHWSYEGATGPDKWGDLDGANATCSIGSQQSPIDITSAVTARQPSLKINWSKRPETISTTATRSNSTSLRAIQSNWVTAALG
jgi:hypothetical protein